MRRFDNALNSDVERPLEDSCESRTLRVVLAQDVDFNGATAVIPRVWYREACSRVSAEGKWCEGFFAHGYLTDSLFAFYVNERRQLGFMGWILPPTSNRDGEGREGGVADEGGD